MSVSTAVTIDTGMFISCACADVHMHCCLSIIKWVDQGVVYPFDYPACLWNQGVRIIEVLLYTNHAHTCTCYTTTSITRCTTFKLMLCTIYRSGFEEFERSLQEMICSPLEGMRHEHTHNQIYCSPLKGLLNDVFRLVIMH